MAAKRNIAPVMYGPPESDFNPIACVEKRRIVVAAAVITDGQRILAMQRGYGKWKGWWEFPGGKVEQGETPESALCREIGEEMDAEIVVDRFLETIVYEYEEFLMTMHLFVCHLKEGGFTMKEHMDARWLGQEELMSVEWLPADIELMGRMRIAELIQK